MANYDHLRNERVADILLTIMHSVDHTRAWSLPEMRNETRSVLSLQNDPLTFSDEQFWLLVKDLVYVDLIQKRGDIHAIEGPYHQPKHSLNVQGSLHKLSKPIGPSSPRKTLRSQRCRPLWPMSF